MKGQWTIPSVAIAASGFVASIALVQCIAEDYPPDQSVLEETGKPRTRYHAEFPAVKFRAGSPDAEIAPALLAEIADHAWTIEEVVDVLWIYNINCCDMGGFDGVTSMSESPVSNLVKRLYWGIACGVAAMLLNLGSPFVVTPLFVKLGIDPMSNLSGFGAGMGLGILIFEGTLFCGLGGLIAGIAVKGKPAITITMGGLLLADIHMMSFSVRVYSACAIAQFACVFLLYRLYSVAVDEIR